MSDQMEATVTLTNAKVQFIEKTRSNPAVVMDYFPPTPFDEGTFLGHLGFGLSQSFVSDGFARVIDRVVPRAEERIVIGGREHVKKTYVHFVEGFDDLGLLSWEGVFDTPPSGYQKPASLVAGLHALAEYEHDLLGRTTRITRWRFTEAPLQVSPPGLLEVTKIAYDDAAHCTATTDPEGFRTVVCSDGAGRPIRLGRAVDPDLLQIPHVQHGQRLGFRLPVDGDGLQRRHGPTPHGDAQQFLLEYEHHGRENGLKGDGFEGRLVLAENQPALRRDILTAMHLIGQAADHPQQPEIEPHPPFAHGIASLERERLHQHHHRLPYLASLSWAGDVSSPRAPSLPGVSI